jgi:putative transposase
VSLRRSHIGGRAQPARDQPRPAPSGSAANCRSTKPAWSGSRSARTLDRVGGRLKQIIAQVAEETRSILIESEVMRDHVHYCDRCRAATSNTSRGKAIKGRSRRLLRDELRRLKSRLPTMWTRSYFVSIVGGALSGDTSTTRRTFKRCAAPSKSGYTWGARPRGSLHQKGDVAIRPVAHPGAASNGPYN